MATISPGWQTDLAILQLTGSQVKNYEDHVVVKTPENPNYHWGNCLLVLDPGKVEDSTFWVQRFEQEFPDKDWLAIGLPVPPKDTSSWEAHGITLENLDVLSADSKPQESPIPRGYSIREFSKYDWATLTLREIEQAIQEGEYEAQVIEEFIQETNLTRQRLCAQGDAAWFGAFHGEKLVSNLGLIKCGNIGRYQAVETDPNHRRKGLASHLLGVAANWSIDHGCNKWVIVTEETNDAGRVYRKAGFQPDLSSVNAYRKPKHS